MLLDETIKPTPAAGAPAKKLDEATATYFAALHLMGSNPGASIEAQTTLFSSALRHTGAAKDIVTGQIAYSPSPAQRIVHLAQKAGLVEGDVFKRLGIKED